METNTSVDISVSEQAAAQIKRMLAEQGFTNHGLRFGLKDGGCSGYTYLLDFEAEPDDDDLVIEQHGVRLFVHPMHLPFLNGSTVGWKDSLMETGIAVDNPNVAQSCGCGVSVTF